MQVLIARLGSENLSLQNQHNFFQTAFKFEADHYRPGVVLILNGLVNAMEPENVLTIAPQVISLVKMTMHIRFDGSY